MVGCLQTITKKTLCCTGRKERMHSMSAHADITQVTSSVTHQCMRRRRKNGETHATKTDAPTAKPLRLPRPTALAPPASTQKLCWRYHLLVARNSSSWHHQPPSHHRMHQYRALEAVGTPLDGTRPHPRHPHRCCWHALRTPWMHSLACHLSHCCTPPSVLLATRPAAPGPVMMCTHAQATSNDPCPGSSIQHTASHMDEQRAYITGRSAAPCQYRHLPQVSHSAGITLVCPHTTHTPYILMYTP